LETSHYIPEQEIIPHANDIDAAFHRIFYSSKLAIAFAYIFGPFLIIPVGQVFGSPSTPSSFSLASNIRADTAMTSDLHNKFLLQPLAENITLPPDLDPLALSPALADAKNLPLSMVEQQNFNNVSFVDNNGVCVTREGIIPTLQQSLLSAFVLFGWPADNHWGSCIAPDKWDPMVSYIMLFLGYQINSQTLMVTWPQYKRTALHYEIQAALKNWNHCITQKLAVSILGII
jgi:hypothetical protein